MTVSMRLLLSTAMLFSVLMAAAPAFAQREAAFVPPMQGGGKNRDSDEIVAATPKLIEAGETIPGITKHLTLFFTNFGGQVAKIENLSLSADSNVRVEVTSNDCEKVGSIKPNDKCAIGLQVTPISPGGWVAEVVMVHDAQGRVSRATITGKTAGEVGAAGQQPGLSLVGANKDQQIDFGDVSAGEGMAVRSVLLANDSPQPLTIKTIDLVGADRSLTLMAKGGCTEGQDVPPGGSCPVTVIWQPTGHGDVSTDLIIQHTGPVGFAVIPVRGKATGGDGRSNSSGSVVAAKNNNTSASDAAASAAAAETAAASLPTPKGKTGAGRIPPIAAAALYGKSGYGTAAGANLSDGLMPFTLRGTVGNRAILAAADGSMVVAGVGETLTGDDGMPYRILNVEPTRVTIDVGGSQQQLTLQGPSSSFGGGGGSTGNAPRPAKSSTGSSSGSKG